MACVVIPAHNEATVIDRTLLSLLTQVGEEDQVVVICNGCSDQTAEVARSVSPRVKVLETDVASKTFALNLGDESALSFPRIYMDADISLSDGAFPAMVRALGSDGLLAASPTPVMDFTGSSWAVKAYYDVWLSMPYCQSGMLGAGVYGLSAVGRSRFDCFPNLIADDGFVRALFKESERGRIKDAQSIVKAPASLFWLIKIKTRSRLGTMELAKKYPELLNNEVKDYSGALANVLARPSQWFKFLLYVYVNLVSRFHAKKRFAHLEKYVWEKDISSR